MPTGTTAYQPVLDQLLNRGQQNASTNVGPLQSTQSILSRFLPDVGNLTTNASGVINNLLQGQPSPSLARRSNAYFGAQSGMPNSDFVRNRGFDLYNQQGDQRQQQGIQDFLSLLGGYTGLTGQQNESNRFSQNLGLQDRQSAVQNSLNAAKIKDSLNVPKQEYSYSETPASGGPARYRYQYYA